MEEFKFKIGANVVLNGKRYDSWMIITVKAKNVEDAQTIAETKAKSTYNEPDTQDHYATLEQ